MEGKSQPIEALEATLCSEFHCLPGDLDGQDTDRMLGILYARSATMAFSKLKRSEKRTIEERKIIGDVLKAKAARAK